MFTDTSQSQAARGANVGDLRIVALTPSAEHPLLATWLPLTGAAVEYVEPTSLAYEPPASTDLLVAWDCYREPYVTVLRRAMEAQIPTLLLADGILEYRNTWENPNVPPGSLFQPVLGHKVACLGRSQARVLESWGNHRSVCEVVGLPRLDRYAGLRRRVRSPDEPFRILVMTALTPFFRDDHRQKVLRSLRDLKTYFQPLSERPAAEVQPVWRLTKGVENEIGVDSTVGDLTGRELADVLQRVDAVITTPSTGMLESMLLDLPVAVLDYCNSPSYVPAAWRIAAPEHIDAVVKELVAPPAPKLLYQRATLHDALECATPAAPRMALLATAMAQAAVQARSRGGPFKLPPRIIPFDVDEGPEPDGLRAAELYPDAPQFRLDHRQALQVEVGHLRRYAAELEQKVQRTPRYEPDRALVSIAIEWRARVEAARVLHARGSTSDAVAFLMAAIQIAQSSGNAGAVLDALIGVAEILGPIDPARTAPLLNLAERLAKKHGRLDQMERVTELCGSFGGRPPVPTGVGA